MLLTSILKSFVVYLYYLKKLFYSQDDLITKPCELENINFQLINTDPSGTSSNQLYQNFPLFIARPDYSFQHSVSAGDSSSFSSIFWTRVTPKFKVAKSSLIPVYFVLALDQCFQDVVLSGVTYTNSLIDFTVKLHIRKLSPNSIYYYKFYDERGSSVSDVGRLKTLPDNHISTNIHLDITDSADYIGSNETDFVLQLNDYRNKFFTRLRDYRYRYSKESRSSNITTLFAGSNPCMYTREFEMNDHTQALLEWFPIRPPKRYLHGKYFEIGDVLRINILDQKFNSTPHDIENEFKSETRWDLFYTMENPNLLEFQTSIGLNNSFVNLRDHNGMLRVNISSNQEVSF